LYIQKIVKFVTIITLSNERNMPQISRIVKYGLMVSMSVAISTLSAQSAVTLSDGLFIYRLTVEKLPDAHYRHYKQEQNTGKKDPQGIGYTVGTVKAITIFPVKDSTHKQVIIPGKNESSWPWTEDNKGEKFIIEDMNFDGNNDIRLLNSADNFTYYCWIFQPATGQFIQDTVLSKFIDPQFDQNQKLVYQNWEYVKDNEKGTQIYQYINGILTLIEEDETSNNYTNKTTTVTIKKRINGQMKMVSRSESSLLN